MMKDIIVLDLDSVLSYTEEALNNYIIEEFGIHIDWENEVENYELKRMPRLTDKMKEELEDVIHNGDLLYNIKPHNYAEHATKKLRNEGFEIAIVTSRPPRLKNPTIEWLNKHDIVYDRFYLIPSLNKYLIVEDIDAKAVVEDRFDVLEKILYECGPLELGLYMVRQPWNKRDYNEYIVKTRDIADAVDRIVDFRRWRGFFLSKCVGNIEKFIKEYQEGGRKWQKSDVDFVNLR